MPFTPEIYYCAVYTVPLDYTNLEGKTLNLAFTILRAESPDPQPDPIVYLAGGPMQMTGEYERLIVNYEPCRERKVLDLTEEVLNELIDASISDSTSDDHPSGNAITE